MRIEAVELKQLLLPMIEPLAAAHGTVAYRKTVFVHVITDEAEGWGECVALNEPTYTEEWSDGELAIAKEFFAPALLRASDVTPESVVPILESFKRHNSAKAALEMAVLDAHLRGLGRSLAEHWNATASSVECAVVVGLIDNAPMVDAIRRQYERGYRHVKLKVEPGRDLSRIDLALREFPDVTFRIDANGSYSWHDQEHRALLKEIDRRGLALIEQPLAPNYPFAYKELVDSLDTPVSLDESITAVEVAEFAIRFGMCDAITLKPGLIGGYLAARRLHELCNEHGVTCAVGGMLETGLARAANLALAATTCQFPAEISPDGRWFDDNVNTEPVDIRDGRIDVPTGPGIGVELDMAVVDQVTVQVHVVSRGTI